MSGRKKAAIQLKISGRGSDSIFKDFGVMQSNEYQGRITGVSAGSCEFLQKLELYLQQRRKGTAPYYSEIPGELSEKMRASSRLLAETNVKVLSSYSGYLTAFTYDRKARFISHSSDTLGAVARFNSLDFSA